MNDNAKCKICSFCYTFLKKKKPTIPHFASSNLCFIGDIPSELQNLTIPEEQLIAIYRHNRFVVKIHGKTFDSTTKQAKIRGNVIVFQQNISSIANVLPLTEESLCDNIKIVFVGAIPPERVEVKKLLKVRRDKIYKALNWLIRYNPLYKDIKISQENIIKLPVDDVPNALWNTIDKCSHEEQNEACRIGYVQNNVSASEKNKNDDSNIEVKKNDSILNDNEVSEKIININTSAVVDVDGIDFLLNDINDYLLKNLLDNKKTKLVDDVKRTYYMIPRS